MSRNYVTPIEVVANSSLGIDGWALFGVGSAEPSGGGVPAGSSDAEASPPARGKYRADNFWISQGGARANLEDGDSSDWDSERDLTVLEPMEGLTDSEIDGGKGDWTEDRHRKWGGNAGYSQSLTRSKPKTYAPRPASSADEPSGLAVGFSTVFVPQEELSGISESSTSSSTPYRAAQCGAAVADVSTSSTTTHPRAAQCGAAAAEATSTRASAATRSAQCGVAVDDTRSPSGAPFGKGSGKSGKLSKPANKSLFAAHNCVCDKFNGEYFCTSSKCRNYASAFRPHGSTTNGRVGTEDGSPWNATTTRRTEAHPLPKPSYQSSAEKFNEVMNSMQAIIANVDERSSEEILTLLKKAAKIMSTMGKAEYRLSDEGQKELLRRIDIRAKKPDSGLNKFDYTGTHQGDALLFGDGLR